MPETCVGIKKKPFIKKDIRKFACSPIRMGILNSGKGHLILWTLIEARATGRQGKPHPSQAFMVALAPPSSHGWHRAMHVVRNTLRGRGQISWTVWDKVWGDWQERGKSLQFRGGSISLSKQEKHIVYLIHFWVRIQLLFPFPFVCFAQHTRQVQLSELNAFRRNHSFGGLSHNDRTISIISYGKI